MKVERVRDVPPLYRFVQTRLPKTLEARILSDGYGCVCTVHVIAEEAGDGWWAWFKRMSSRGIATVYDHTLELRRPEYFSDFETICQDYENQTGKEVTLRYWESAK